MLLYLEYKINYLLQLNAFIQIYIIQFDSNSTKTSFLIAIIGKYKKKGSNYLPSLPPNNDDEMFRLTVDHTGRQGK